MSESRIVVIDPDPLSYQVVQNCFYYQAVDVVWIKTIGVLTGRPLGAKIILIALVGNRPYEFVADVSAYNPDAIIFVLSNDQNAYNSFEARNSGVVGAFFKPLHFDAVQSRLEEFLDVKDSNTGPLEVPPLKERRANLLSFYRAAPQDIEDIVLESLPVLIEKILQLELQGNSTLKRMISEYVHEVVQEEMEQYRSGHSEKIR